jgi:hypothetical protein
LNFDDLPIGIEKFADKNSAAFNNSFFQPPRPIPTSESDSIDHRYKPLGDPPFPSGWRPPPPHNWHKDKSSAELEKLGVDPDWDLKSIASLDTFRDSALGSSLPSDMSVSVVQGLPRTAQEEVLIILNSDTHLKSLFEEAARRIDKSRFVRNTRRLFLSFHKDLEAKAVDAREKDAARIIEKHAHWLASRLFDVCDPNGGSNAEAMAAHLNQQVNKRPGLEKYLASLTQQAKPHASPVPNVAISFDAAPTTTANIRPEEQRQAEDDGSDSDDNYEESQNGEDKIDYSKFPNLDHIRNFIINGEAFESLRHNTSQWVRPASQPLQTEPGSVDALTATTSLPPTSSTQILEQVLSEDSSVLSGTTDITVPDADSDSDDDGTDLTSDPDLYDGVPEDRILKPQVSNIRGSDYADMSLPIPGCLVGHVCFLMSHKLLQMLELSEHVFTYEISSGPQINFSWQPLTPRSSRFISTS